MARDEAMLRKVGDFIVENPEKYKQSRWCGTTMCVAGTAVFLRSDFKRFINDSTVQLTDRSSHFIEELGQETLGLDYDDAQTLFYAAWLPDGVEDDESLQNPETLALLVRDALYHLADGATIDEVSHYDL